MKGFIKKISVFLMIAAIAMFMAVPMASASWWPFHNTIWGHYSASGTLTCTLAPCGFTNFIPNQCPPPPDEPGQWSLGQSTWEAEYTFKGNGTGSATGTVRSIDYPSPVAGLTPSVWTASFSYEFTYTVAYEGQISFKAVKDTFILVRDGFPFPTTWDTVPSDGVISEDGNTITISHDPKQLISLVSPPGTPMQMICLTSLVLIKAR